MALIASSFTMEVILLIIGLYLFDGGLIRKFASVGLYIYGLNTALAKQVYVSDLTSQPTNVTLGFTSQLQQDWAVIFAFLTMITLAWTFLSLYKIVVEAQKLTLIKDPMEKKSKRFEFILEELV
jgi:hypothetical protein